MQSKNTLTNNTLDLTSLKFIVSNDVNKLILPDCINPDFLFGLSMIGLFNFKIIFVRTDNCCPECGTELTYNGDKQRKINGWNNIYVKKHVCPNCGKHFTADLTNFITPGSMYTNAVKHWGVKLSEIGEESYHKKSELFESLFNIPLPKSTVYDHEDKVTDNYLEEKEKEVERCVKELELKDNAIYHYDEQFPTVNKNNMTRMMVIDAQTKYPYYDYLEEAVLFDAELIEKYLHVVLDDIPHEVLVTDGYQAYPSIIKKFDMIQQRCVFHMMYNVGMDIYPVIKRINRNNKNKYMKLEKINEKLTKKLEEYKPTKGRIKEEEQKEIHDLIKELEQEIREIKKEIKLNKKQIKELNRYLERISNIFEAENMTIARGRLTRLTNNTEHMPKCVTKSTKRIERNFTELTQFIQNELIPKTNNLIELYFKTTLPKQLKRRYRTIKGLLRRLKSARIRWIHRNVLENEEPINSFFNYTTMNMVST